MTLTDAKVLLAHRVQGEGEPLLLLNGIAMSMASWEPVAKALASSYHVIRCDFRGQMLSPGVPPADVTDHVHDVVALLELLGTASCHVLATSFGGAVGTLLAARHPERVRSLISVASAVGFTDEMAEEVGRWRQATLDSLAGPDRGVLFDVFEEVVYSPAWVASHASERAERRRQIATLPDAWFEGLAGLLASARSFSLEAELARIRCPTLVLAAEYDGFIPMARSCALAAAIPNAEHQVISGAGHAVVVEQPETLAELCLEFFGSLG